jgi:hypothetical protein
MDITICEGDEEMKKPCPFGSIDNCPYYATGWISVEDRLPDELQLALVIDRQGYYNLDRNYNDGTFDDRNQWWMPVPRQPEEEG